MGLVTSIIKNSGNSPLTKFLNKKLKKVSDTPEKVKKTITDEKDKVKSNPFNESGLLSGNTDSTSLTLKITNLSQATEKLKDCVKKANESLSISENKIPESKKSNSTKSKLAKCKDICSKITNKVTEAGILLSAAKENMPASVKNTFNNKKTNLNDSSVKNSSLSKEELISYDPNGLKHFVNLWLNIMTAENMPYKIIAGRRWAVDQNDKKVFGNAFLNKKGTKTYKMLDSDNKLYWLSDFDSRHLYGEAVDIIPTSSMSELLSAICDNKNVCDLMHEYGLCLQLEYSESGAAKGQHFHISTDENNPQTKWWGIVNKRRQELNLNTYSTIISSSYFEKETKNEVKQV